MLVGTGQCGGLRVFCRVSTGQQLSELHQYVTYTALQYGTSASHTVNSNMTFMQFHLYKPSLVDLLERGPGGGQIRTFW